MATNSREPSSLNARLRLWSSPVPFLRQRCSSFKQPIPNPDRWRLNIDPLVIPSTVTIRTNEPLPVQAGLVGDGDAPQKGEQPIRISGPVTVRGDVDAAVRCPVPSPSARMTL